ncbi:50S ribosomal protein L22 [Sulfuracidifex tepidarius]|uniref:Large ribosomal subunit protein uL22 n=1 Tax=Sulfuracidifex tepidarius TaxID=1294262 RepID=A0A510DW26_9CREN|nr:50S ribosomal protein L22 [Sulfuracidifex tepidarius]BBG24397.1 50S ribosomal protein L22 [Sulfuracidifex tepidarius]BBG27155.1 50S ribosomal protein L22 [Sulfuracidifex tepidarius]
MSKWIYPELKYEESKVAKAVVREAPVSIRDLYNVCKAVRGMKLTQAKSYLQNVIDMKEAVPYWRYNTGASHKSNLEERWGIKSGRYPRKAAKYVLKLLDNLEVNASSKGLDTEKLKIVHIAAHKGLTLKRFIPRAFGRSSKKYRYTSNIEAVVAEVD